MSPPPPLSPTSLAGRRVVLVLPHLEMGGVQRQALALAAQLRGRHGAEVSAWGFTAPGPSGQEWRDAGVPWRVVAAPIKRRAGRRLRRLVRFAWQLRRARAELVVGYTALPNVAAALCWRAGGARGFVWSQRDPDGALPGWERRAVRATPWFVSNSAHATGYLRELGAPPERIRVIPNGVALPTPARSRAAWRRALGAGEKRLVACMVAHPYPRKDHATLLRAWRRVVDAVGPAGDPPLLVLAGGRSDQSLADLERTVAELALAPHVRLAGFVRDVSGLLAACDLGVFTSQAEGCPNGVLECMAAGLPVLAADIPGTREALGTQEPDVWLPPGEAEPLARAVLGLWQRPERRAELGVANRRRVEERFGVERMGDATAELLVRALAGARDLSS